MSGVLGRGCGDQMSRPFVEDEVLKVLRLDGARSIEDAAIRSMLDDLPEHWPHSGAVACPEVEGSCEGELFQPGNQAATIPAEQPNSQAKKPFSSAFPLTLRAGPTCCPE